MANPPKPCVVDYARSSRSKCQTCKKDINREDVLRIGRRFSSTIHDGSMTNWYHATCTCFPKIPALHEVEGIDGLRWKDQQKILEYIGDPGQGFMPRSGESITDHRSNLYAIENAKNSRATCKSCNERIGKDKVRISTLPEADQCKSRREARAWHHVKCFLGRGWWTSPMEKMPGWDNLTDEDKESVQSIAKPYIQESNEEEHGRKGHSKKRKADERKILSSAKRLNTGSVNLREGSSAEAGEFELKLKKQADALWTIIDDLQKHVETTELRKMLEANDQIREGSVFALRERCYYILQIIVQHDRRPVYHVFRKWDRVGNDRVACQKLEMMEKSAAVSLFKELFRKHTGNEWEDWVNKGTFEKRPDKYFPLDLDYRVDEPEEVSISQWTAQSKLDPLVLDLMNMLFDPKIYSAALKDFDIRMPVMPLGKLRESHILKGFEALKEVEEWMSKPDEPDVRLKESHLVDASSKFFTLIPTVNPRVIRDSDSLKLKNRMLESLSEMEKASKLMRFEIKDEDPFYANYKKLHCDMSPLPRNSSDYQLIERYLKKTHCPTHDWELELEDAYRIDREGERDAYMPRKSNLKNCMLLWHGSRVTNFLGILSTGLKIAPPEAPPTGYMFGKGIYFADLASKSSKYCNASKENAMGLLLLSEVALGEVYETEKAEYMEEPRKGKNSTKGLGIYKYSTEHEQWGDGVIVPCGGLDLKSGKPSEVKKDHLKYNEYIVYDTKQVKLQFLLKVRFHYKKP